MTTELTKILVVEDSPSKREYLSELVEILGFRAYSVMQKANFLTDLNKHKPDVLLLGSCTNHAQLKAFATVAKYEEKSIPIIYILDGSSNFKQDKILPSSNVHCLPKMFSPEDLKLAIDSMADECQKSRYEKLKRFVIGRSPAVTEIREQVLRLSNSDITVLITGESGTGKELVARAVHDFSPRAKKPFIKVNSAALPGNLIESELFGYEKGAFTGAWRSKPGKFVLAHSGTLLLDEVGEIPLGLQPKLLQVLEDSELSVLGGTTNARIDVRILAATNCNLRDKVLEGLFRSDLYYRLNVINIHIPPLRERMEDIRPLFEHLLEKHAPSHGNEVHPIDSCILEQMHHYTWPGNIRELENVIKTYCVFGDDKYLFDTLMNPSMRSDSSYGTKRVYTPWVGKERTQQRSSKSLKEVCREAVRRAETETILDVLSYTRWNRRKAADLLKISYKALLNKIKEYEIEETYTQLIRRDTIAGEYASAGSP